MIQAGKLRHAITIQSPSESRDELNQVQRTWSDTTTRRASIETTGSTIVATAEQSTTFATHKITLRQYSLSPTQRIKFGSRIFNIVAIEQDEAKQSETVILVQEVL